MPRAAGARPAERDRELAQIERLLRQRAAALEAGRIAAYAGTAIGPQRAHDRVVARNARGVGLRDVGFAVASADVRGRRATLDARSVYSVRGVRGRFAVARRILVARTRAGWRVRREVGRSERNPWEVGRVRARRTRHFVVLAPAGLPTDALVHALEGGYARMGDVLRRPRLRPRYLVVVAAGTSAARALTERIRGVESLAAISDAEVREAGVERRVIAVPSQRLVIVWPPFSALDPDGQLRVVTHELTHAALAGVTSGRTPSWLLEGIALYVSEDQRVDEAARLLAGEASGAALRAMSLSRLSRPDAIARLDGDGQRAAYAYVSAAAFFIAGRYGRVRYLRLYRAFNDQGLAGHLGAEVTDRAVRRVLGLSLVRLDRDLRTWITTH